MRNGWQLKRMFVPKTRLAGVLAFLIPGFFQDLLGQGVRSGRFLAMG